MIETRKIVWTDDYSVGVKEIDVQHQKLLGILNDTLEILGDESLKEKLPDILERLGDYANYHFATEEKYFREYNYEETDKHIEQHRIYVEKAKILRVESDIYTQAFEVADFLEDWWLQHINVTDKKYTKCFNDHGLY